MDIKERIAAAKTRAEAAEKLATSKALTAEELELKTLLAREAAAQETAAAADADRRAADMAARVEAADAKSGGSYLVTGVDLVSLFPLGKAPPVEKLPGKGVVVLRSPDQAATDESAREYEAAQRGAKTKGVPAIMADLACACLVDPDPAGPEGGGFRHLLEVFPPLGLTLGNIANQLGGAKRADDKRGRG